MNHVNELLRKINDRELLIGVIGMGYVGLPLALEFSHAGFRVIGFDIDKAKTEKLNAGLSYIRHIPSDKIDKAVRSGKFESTNDFSKIAETGAVLICVPTPLDEHRSPDLSYIKSTGRTIAPYLSKGTLVCLESTTYPGTTEQLLGPVLEKGSGMAVGSDIMLAFSPEREDPNNPDFTTSTIPKVLGGCDEQSLRAADALYSTIVKQTVPVSSCGVAEAAKLLENIFRSVNIALVNEMKVILDRMDINVWEVIDAASTKPFGFMPFYPGPGLGGHCIPIDPFYLTWRAREFGLTSRFIELAGEINTAMPEYVVNKTIQGLNEKGKALRGSNILLVGLAYKPNVDDLRESPGLNLIKRFEDMGGIVDYYDPYVPTIPQTRKYGSLAGRKSIDFSDLDKYDAIVISTRHNAVDHESLMQLDTVIVDTRNALGKASGRALVIKA